MPFLPAKSSAVLESNQRLGDLRSGLTFFAIQDYFSKVIGPVKKVLLTYGPNGKSRGVATIIFANADSASKAVKTQNNIKVDQRPMRVSASCHVFNPESYRKHRSKSSWARATWLHPRNGSR